ncbi:MAG: DUF4411 family protein [Planctomycetota bacterium]
MILDASAIIEVKRLILATEQWEFFEKLKRLVQKGLASFPKKVAQELRQARHHDTPEAWSLNVIRDVQYPKEPDPETVRRVMAIAGEVIDEEAEGEQADPYVIAHALEIADCPQHVSVSTSRGWQWRNSLRLSESCRKSTSRSSPVRTE